MRKRETDKEVGRERERERKAMQTNFALNFI